MKKRHYLPIYTVLLLFVALLTQCSQNELELDFEREKDTKSNPYRVDLESALKTLEKSLSNMDNQSTTRSTNRRISKIDVIRSAVSTRSNNNLPDTLLYIVNYDNNNGFGIISADRRLIPIYAMSPQGSFSLNDTLFNDGLRHYIRTLRSDIEQNFPTIDIEPIDSTPFRPGGGGWVPNPGPISKEEMIVSPLLGSIISKWHQQEPFNSKVTSPYPAGCTVLATAMIMAYYKWPDTHKTTKFNWDIIINNRWQSNVGDLILMLHSKDYLDAKYIYRNNQYATGADDNNIPRTFSKWKYNTPTKATGLGSVSSALTQKKPVIIAGSDYQTNQGGHTWILDGLYRITGVNVSTPTNPDGRVDYYHTVWGWNGTSNGFFYYGRGYVTGQPDLPEHSESTIPVDYKFDNFRIYYNFTPLK